MRTAIALLLLCTVLSCGVVRAARAADASYEFVELWPKLENAWYFREPRGVAVDADARVYVADDKNNRILAFDAAGKLLAAFNVERPWDVAVDGKGNIFVTGGIPLPHVMKLTPDGMLDDAWPQVAQDAGVAQGIAVDSAGRVYVADSLSEQVLVYGPDGKLLNAWGGPGTGDGEFETLYDVAVDKDGNIYVADCGNGRIQKFNADGKFVTKWGRKREAVAGLIVPTDMADDDFLGPVSLAVDTSGDVYVVDSGEPAIKRFTSDGRFVAQWGRRMTWTVPAEHEGAFGTAWGIAVAPGGRIYVADASKSGILVFDQKGAFVTEWGSGGAEPGQLRQPGDVAVDKRGIVYIVDGANHRVQVLMPDGTIGKWPRLGGDGARQLREPAGIAVDAAANVYVASAAPICKFSPTGEFIAALCEGLVDGADDVALDSTGNIYVADTGRRAIRKYTADGRFLTQWGPPEDKARRHHTLPFGSALRIAIDASDNVYVTDYGRDLVQKFSSQGKFLLEWGGKGDRDGQLSSPSGIAVDKDGFVFVADTFNNRIQEFTAAGEFVAKWGTRGTGDGEFNAPNGVAVDEHGNVYVTDQQNNRIQKFRPKSEPETSRAGADQDKD